MSAEPRTRMKQEDKYNTLQYLLRRKCSTTIQHIYTQRKYAISQSHNPVAKKVCDLDSLRSKCILEDRKLKKRLEALFDNERLRNWASEEKL